MAKYSFKDYIKNNDIFSNFNHYEDDQLSLAFSDHLAERGDIGLSEFIKIYYLDTPHFIGVKSITINNLEANYNRIETLMRMYDDASDKKEMNKILSVREVFFNDVILPIIKEISKIFKTNYYNSCLIYKLTNYNNLIERRISNENDRLERIRKIISGIEVVNIYSYDGYDVVAKYVDRGNNRLKTVCWDTLEFSFTSPVELIRMINSTY